MRDSTLLYKIEFVLGDFVQLWTSVNVLRRFKVGYAKLRCSVKLGALNASLTLDIFHLWFSNEFVTI